MDREQQIKEILDYLRCAYTGARMDDDLEMMCRISRAIIAFSCDDVENTPTWEEMQEAYMLSPESYK